jgi:L-iditol 2-dehydrogenase
MSNPAAVLHGIRDIRIEDQPEPQAGPGQVVVEVGAVGICGSDVHYYEHGRIGDFVVEAPMIIGHEAAGTVIAVGDGVDETRVGQIVALEPGVPDFTCDQCMNGRYNLCPNVQFFATPPVHGAIVRRVVVPAVFAHPAPEGLSYEQAAMAEPVSVGISACRKAGVTVGDRVLLTGAGPIGLLAAQVARSFGAGEVALTDSNAYRLGVARDLGFAAHDAADTVPGQYDVLLECSGSPQALADGMRLLAPAGRVVLIGMGADSVAIEVPLVQNRELTITGIFRYANTYPSALQLIASGQVNVARVITHRFPLEATDDALTLVRRDPHSIKAVVDLSA